MSTLPARNSTHDSRSSLRGSLAVLAIVGSAPQTSVATRQYSAQLAFPLDAHRIPAPTVPTIDTTSNLVSAAGARSHAKHITIAGPITVTIGTAMPSH